MTTTFFKKIPEGILSPRKKKLKPILSQKNLKIKQSMPATSRNFSNTIFKRNISKGELSVLLFQGNDVDLVRSINPDQDRDICSNILLKGQLKNNIIKNNEYNIISNNNGNSGNNIINLPKIKRITINNILESEQRLNQNKKEAQKNLAYSQLEGELCGELKKIRNEYKAKKEEKNVIYKEYKKIMDKIDEMNLEIQIINSKSIMDNIKDQKSKTISKNVSKELPNTEEALDDKIKEIDNGENKKGNKNDDLENKMNKIKNLYQKKKETDFQKKIKFDKIKQLKDELNTIIEPLQKINKTMVNLRKKERIVINKLMIHYETLLFKGEEVRNEGLIWIIKAMWSLGENVPMSFIPPFLDFQCIEFLFQYAHKSIELENTKKFLNELKNRLQLEVHNIFYSVVSSPNNKFKKYSSSFEFKTDLIRKNRESKKSIAQTNFIKGYINDFDEDDKKISSVKEMTNIMNNKKNKIDITKLSGIEKIDELKLKIKEIEAEIVDLKKAEINRVFKEFVENDYQNKYHVPIDIVLAALFGEHSKNIEVNKFSKFKKEYFDELKNIRFYQYGQDKNSI